jgi:hypothetical protein
VNRKRKVIDIHRNKEKAWLVETQLNLVVVKWYWLEIKKVKRDCQQCYPMHFV